ncbi:hypothetical protein CCR94_13710 [Rhodoblastus sphagnicola]|uniref:Copper-binding protein n=1 Tax=Rhodoblastus sphagnicola TaxID=333368 RepID=A0A2S6N5W3_9HYPH|nr:copper-binding protein [Rhodoblastus sphagnicola]MBB4197367.1 Cu/Ag efflux protein CusF [Rhodoblastus sphagnicola]PPQ30015.1 hypothetical protein CCR94_13710 [Rhodoblastus sphagnicola]
MKISVLAAALSVLPCAPLACIASAALASNKPVVVAQADRIFHGKGRITGLDVASGLVSIDHEAIPGLMDAMEMQYQAKPAKILEGLKIGESVTFALEGKSYQLLEISRAAPAR